MTYTLSTSQAHRITSFLFILLCITSNFLYGMNETNDLFPSSSLIQAMRKNIQYSIQSSDEITPHISYFTFTEEFNCEIIFLKKLEIVGKILLSCTPNKNYITVCIDLICLNHTSQNKGYGTASMKHLMHFFQKLAFDTKKNILFYLYSAMPTGTLSWYKNPLSKRKQSIIRAHFYSTLGLTSSAEKKSLYGVFFIGNPTEKLPTKFAPHKFGFKDVTQGVIDFKTPFKRLNSFFHTLSPYFYPLFTEKKAYSHLLFPFIKDTYSYNCKKKCNEFTALSYNLAHCKTQKTKLPLFYLIPLFNVSRKNSKELWQLEELKPPYLFWTKQVQINFYLVISRKRHTSKKNKNETQVQIK